MRIHNITKTANESKDYSHKSLLSNVRLLNSNWDLWTTKRTSKRVN